MHVKEWCTKPCVVGTLGLILAGFGTLFIFFWQDIFDQRVESELKLRPDTRTYEMWKSPPIPMTLDIYLYNWTNPEEFLNFTTKPNLVELGPYVFVEKPDKVNITWHPGNSTVSYMRKSRFYFDEEKSKGSLDDVITSLNVVPLAAAETARHKGYMDKKKVSIGLQIYNQQIAITKLAREFLFEGYEDDLVSVAKELPFLTEGQAIPFDRVGWFYMRNDTADLTGMYNAHTGESDISMLGKLMNWNYAPRTEFFKEHCGMINGSAGEMYPPKVTKDQTMSFYTADLCRSLPMDFEKEEVVEGITGYKFTAGDRAVDNGTMYPENWCFCGDECVPSGVLNISACRFGTPVFMSFPHFYKADPFFLNQVDGMSPDEEKHKFYMTFEPTLGIPLDVAARLQLNLLVRPSPGITLYEDVPEVYFPIMWFEQRVTVMPDLASELKLVHLVPTIGYGVLWIIIFFGLILILWFPLSTLLCGKRFDKAAKQSSNGQAVSNSRPNVSEGQESDIPLMFKDQGRRNGDLQPVTTMHYNVEKDKSSNERFS